MSVRVCDEEMIFPSRHRADAGVEKKKSLKKEKLSTAAGWKTLAKATCGDGTSKDGLFLPAGVGKCTHGSWCFYGVVVDGVVLSLPGNDGENYGNTLSGGTMVDVRKSIAKL